MGTEFIVLSILIGLNIVAMSVCTVVNIIIFRSLNEVTKSLNSLYLTVETIENILSSSSLNEHKKKDRS